MADSAKLTPAKVQKLLTNSDERIKLHTTVSSETEKVYEAIKAMSTSTHDVTQTAKSAIKDFESISDELRLLLAYGCYFGTKEQEYLWKGAIARLGTDAHHEGSTFLLTLQHYPALLALYASGLSALAAGNVRLVKELLEAKTKSQYKEPVYLVQDANTMMLQDAGNAILGYERRKTPLSDHLFELFSASFPKELAFGMDFEELFDKWELLIGMFVADVYRERSFGRTWGPVGRFSWRNASYETSVLKILKQQLNDEQGNWSFIKVGMFGGSHQRAVAAFSSIEKIAEQVNFF